MNKLTYDQARKRVESCGFKLSNYGGSSSARCTFQCTKGHTWETSLSSVTNSNRTKCPHCAGQGKITEKIAKEHIESCGCVLVEYGGTGSAVSKYKCHCGYSWSGKFTAFKTRVNPCARCAGHVKFTVEDITKLVKQIGYKLIHYGGDVMSPDTIVECQNGHHWQTSYNNIRAGRRRCPHCTGRHHKLTEEILISKIKEKHGDEIILVNYGGSSLSKSTFRCSKGHEWITTTTVIYNHGCGCPTCSGNAPVTKEDAKQRVEERGLILVRYPGNVMDYSTLRCTVGHEWEVRLSNIINNTRGCPTCANYGYNPGKPGYLYVHTFNGFIKIGITNYIEQRNVQLDNQTIDGITYTIENTISWYFENGSDAATIESMVLKAFGDRQYTGLLESSFDGRTELFENHAHQEILDYVNDNYDIVWE